MELYVAIAVGAMTGFGASVAHTCLLGKWWLAAPAGALGGLAGSALWADSLAGSVQDSVLAATAIAAAIGGAIAGLIATVARRLLIERMRASTHD